MFDGLFSPTHIILVLVAALIIFGPKRLPDIGKSLGKGIREFKGALSHIGDDEPEAPTPVVQAPAAPADVVVQAPAPAVAPAPVVPPPPPVVPAPPVVVAPPPVVEPASQTPAGTSEE